MNRQVFFSGIISKIVKNSAERQSGRMNNPVKSGKISKLPDEVVSKIAAGEVVMNPASVVKELVENSIDAGAFVIEIQIRDGGKSYIKVVDNGMGMSKEDLALSVQRYTTSKISSLEDIYNITSYGFRGEALASIGEVSRLVITTSNGSESYKLEMVGGKIIKITETFRERGTTVEVYDLFFNIPARRKFLSSEKVERRMVTEVIERFLLTKPEVKFVFKSDEEIVYNAPQSNLTDRFKLIFPEAKVYEVIESGSGDIKISGIVSSPQFFRRNRTGQLFFVNNRFVIDNLLHLSLERGYGESLVEGSHPYAVLFIDLPPQEVDVNVHPQKLQVKFSEPRLVYDSIARCVRETIRKIEVYRIFVESPVKNSIDITFNNRLSDIENVKEDVESVVQIKNSDKNFEDFLLNSQNNPTTTTYKSYERTQSYQPLHRDSKESPTISSTFFSSTVLPSTFEKSGRFTIFRNRYIVVEDVDGIVIIDFHAAHERIIYEILKEKNFESIQLLIPVEINIGKSLSNVLESISHELIDMGFEFELEKAENSTKVVLKSIPSLIKITQVQETFLEVLEEYRIPFNKPKSISHVLASKACKTAVKTGDKLSEEEVSMLIDEIKRKNLLTCPHGRPIMMKITFNQLDSYFERR